MGHGQGGTKGQHMKRIIFFWVMVGVVSLGGAAKPVSKKLFDAAVEFSDGLDMGPYLTYAESVSKVRQNKDEFIRLLNEALKIQISSENNYQLTNTISKNRAEWLLDNIDEFFY